VIPQSATEKAHMKIYTVPTATYENDSLILHNLDFESLTEKNLLKEPDNIEFFKTNTSKPSVRYPFIAE
jgi:hypothetical protein